MEQYKKIHFIGIGGIGISALAYLALAEGKMVTGSDSGATALTNDLIENGAHVSIGHDSQNVNEDTELVIYTEAIDTETNPEYKKAKDMRIPVLSYFEALGQVSRTKKTIAVVGTHGKTTTTAMLGLALIKADLDPTVIVGSKVKEFGGRNIYIGKGDLFVVEGCEYRRSFLSLEPFGVIFLNCEAEHLDYYKDEEDYMKAYEELIHKIPTDGFMVANMDDKNVEKLIHQCAGQLIPVHEKEVRDMNLKLKVIGDFNKVNAAHAYKADEAVGAQLDAARNALEKFGGTWRRLETKGEFNGAVLIDDYGHHPTEVSLTLKAIRDKYDRKRLICVFQPHQYSRTHLMIDEFRGAFKDADKVIIPNIYEARDSDEDKAKMDAEKLVNMLADTHPDAEWGKGFDNTFKLLKKTVKKDDVVVTMGAGSIGEFAERLAG
jgi:UDP-N-acetylmuramate--alanine ligase